MPTITLLATPPLPRIVPEAVFDGFGACLSTTLEWRRPSAGAYSRWDDTTPLDGADPTRMVFVFRAPCPFLPMELAKLHAFGLDLDEELALAPYGIDDATDAFFERRGEGKSPADWMWLAADNLNALFWGLHDWSHFHNHGEFEQRAATEFQCDTAALAWLWINREAISLRESVWKRLCGEVHALTEKRFRDEGRPSLASGWSDARVRALAELPVT